jgi:hypothetical protein
VVSIKWIIHISINHLLIIFLEERIVVVSCAILQLMNVLVFCTNNCIWLPSYMYLNLLTEHTRTSWYSQDLKKPIIQKKIAHRKYKHICSLADYQVFTHLRSLCNRLSRECYKQYYESMEFINAKIFWSLFNQNTQTRNCLIVDID